MYALTRILRGFIDYYGQVCVVCTVDVPCMRVWPVWIVDYDGREHGHTNTILRLHSTRGSRMGILHPMTCTRRSDYRQERGVRAGNSDHFCCPISDLRAGPAGSFSQVDARLRNDGSAGQTCGSRLRISRNRCAGHSHPACELPVSHRS